MDQKLKRRLLFDASRVQVIEKFRKDVYNVLVATSIGEEGLDIGEVDFIIIYNSPKTSIKAVSLEAVLLQLLHLNLFTL